MTVPDLTPVDDAPPSLPDDDIFALIDSAPTGTPQAARLVAAAAAAPAMPSRAASAPARGKAGPVLGYQGRPTPSRPQRGSFEETYDLKRDVYAPTALIAGSFCIYFAWLLIHGTAAGGGTLAAYGAMMFTILVVKTVLMIGGAFIVAPMAGVSFGPFWTAILKLAAVTFAPDVLVTIIQEAIGVPGAGLVAGAVGLACYWGLMSWLFQFDAGEAWSVVMLFGVLRWFLTMVLAFAAMSLVMSGRSLPGGGSEQTTSQEAIQFDETVANMKENNLTEEGLAYIERTGRQSGKTDLIKRLYAAGAKDVSFTLAKDINGKTEPLGLAVEWPRDVKKREALLAAINDSIKLESAARAKAHPEWGKDEPELLDDEGGKYIELPVGH